MRQNAAELASGAAKVVVAIVLLAGWAMLFTPLGPAVGEGLGWQDDSPMTTLPTDCNSQPWDPGC